MRNYLLLFFLILFSIFTGFAQQSKIDSLVLVLKTMKEDTNKVNLLNDMADQLEGIGNYNQSKQYANEALILSQKQKFKFGEGKANFNLAYVYMDEGDYPRALKYYTTSLKFYGEIGFKKGIASNYINMGAVYDKEGNFPEALKNYFASLKLFEELDNKIRISAVFNNIGSVYEGQGNHAEALKNFQASMVINQELGDQYSIAVSYNNIGNVANDAKNYSEALKNYTLCLKIGETIGNKMLIASSYNNIARTYEFQGKYPEALKNDIITLKLMEEIGDKREIAMIYGNLGSVSTKLKKYSEAAEYLAKAKKMSEEVGVTDILRDTYAQLTRLDSAKGNYKGAFEDQKLYMMYEDSLDNQETRKKTIQGQMTYDFEKKEAVADAEHKSEMDKQHAIAEEKSRKQKLVIWSVIIGLLLVIVFSGFVFRSLRITHKQKDIIELQKSEVEKQKDIIEEKHKEITDSINYAERIQHSFLATKKLLDEHLKNYFVFFQPKDVVSGDFYWGSKLANGNFALVTADSTGHGVPGAIMSILNISCLEKSVEEKQLVEPSQILDHTRSKIIERLKKDGSVDGGKDGMDCSLVSFDFKNNKLTYAAAYNPVWILRNSGETGNEWNLLELSPDKMPVGKHDKDNVPFSQHTIELQKNDMVYTFTDGMPDQFGGPKGKKFLYKQLKELLISLAGQTVEDQKEKLYIALNSWKGSLEQVDDICLIGVKI